MFWRSKPKPAVSPVSPQSKPAVDPPDPAKALAQALSDYERVFYKEAKGTADPDVEAAKKIVAQAREFVSNSRLGYALSRPLLEYVKHWPSWSSHTNFSEHCKPPFRYIGGSRERADKVDTVIVDFSYHDRPYRFRFADEGTFQWASDYTAHGKAELIQDGKSVLGIDISSDTSKEFSPWGMSGVYAFLPGPWMKDLIEMAALIDAQQARRSEDWQNKDALDRAKGITLPD